MLFLLINATVGDLASETNATAQQHQTSGPGFLCPEGVGWAFIAVMIACLALAYHVTKRLIHRSYHQQKISQVSKQPKCKCPAEKENEVLQQTTAVGAAESVVSEQQPLLESQEPKCKCPAEKENEVLQQTAAVGGAEFVVWEQQPPREAQHETEGDGEEQDPRESGDDSTAPVDVLLAPRARTRNFEAMQPAASLKGIQRVGIMAVSPCQSYALVSCRRTGALVLIPRGSEESLVTALDDSSKLVQMLGLEDHVVVTSVSFDPTGHFFVLRDSTHNTLLCYSVAYGGVFDQWALKLPKGQIVAGKSKVSVLRNAEQVAFLNSADCSIEIMSSSGAKIGKDRFKVGRAAALAFVDPLIACAGKDTTQLLVSEVVVRDSVTLGKRVIVAGKPRVAFMQILVPGSPKMNTRHLLVAAFATGCVEVYNLDVRWKDGEDLKPIGGFDDAEYSSGMDGMAVSVIGDSYHEALVVCLWHRTDFSIYVQNKVDPMARSSTDPPTLTMRIAVDVCDAYEGGNIVSAQFIGKELLTTGNDAARPVRLWDLEKYFH